LVDWLGSLFFWRDYILEMLKAIFKVALNPVRGRLKKCNCARFVPPGFLVKLDKPEYDDSETDYQCAANGSE
jgi:hypothetical protein